MAKYFRALEDAFPYHKLDEVYYRYVKESLGAETGNIIDPLLAIFKGKIKTDIAGRLTETYLSGSAEMVEWGVTKAGIPITYEGPPIEEAVGYAKEHGAKLVTQMDGETKRRLAKTISDGIKNKRGIPGLQRDIRHTFADMSRNRAAMIARTETNDALSQAFMDKSETMGIDGKENLLGPSACEICASNTADGVIPLKQSFSSGHMRPPYHPNCACSLAPVMLPAKVKPPVARPIEPPRKPKPPARPPKATKPTKSVGRKAKTGLDSRTQREFDRTLSHLKKENLSAMRQNLNDPNHSPVVGTREEIAKYVKGRKLPFHKGKGWDGYYDPQANQAYIIKGLETTSETIVHELGHQYYFNVMKTYTLRTKDFTLFNKVNQLYATAEKTRHVVSGYSFMSPEEYFAEGFMHFIKCPMKLKRLDPGLFDYFNKFIFKGAVA